MEADSRQGECWRCGAEIRDALVCPGCQAVQPLPADLDYFRALGLPRRLAVDLADLERRYLDASRALHPDRFQTASPREQELSLAASALVNRARRTLRSSVARGRYWLELHGDALGADNNRVPPELAALVFDVQEQLGELRAGQGDRAAVAEARNALASRLTASVAELEGQYAQHPSAHDAAALAALKARLAEIAYLRTLLRDVDAAAGS